MKFRWNERTQESCYNEEDARTCDAMSAQIDTLYV